MSKIIRRLLYICFVLIYFIITPIIILYAAGYKFNGKGITMQRTGMFILDSKPRGATVFIDNKTQQNFVNQLLLKKNYLVTPAKIKNLLPGEYDVRLELNGYWSWGKKLRILPGTSTYAEDIYLFKKDIPISLLNYKITDLKLSPDGNRLAILSQNNLAVLNLADDKITEAAVTAPVGAQDAIWSNEGNKIIFNGVVYNSENLNEEIDLKQYLNNKIEMLSLENNVLYYIDNRSLNLFDLTNLTGKKVIESQSLIMDYLVKNNILYYLIALKQSVKLNFYRLDTKSTIRSIDLPQSHGYSFINSPNNLLNLYDKQYNKLYLIDPNITLLTPLQATVNDIKLTYWIDNNRLLFANDFEIWILNLATQDKILVTRISDSINGLIWHPSNNYIIYSTDNGIVSIELDQREKRNINFLGEYANVSNPFLNTRGNIIYFTAKIGNQEGLWKLALQ